MISKTKHQATAMSPSSLRIGEVAKTSGVSIETLRFYERSGLLGRPARTQSGYRIYDAQVLERLDFIRRAQVLGFSLDEIKQIIAEKQTGANPCSAVREIVRARLRELDEQMREMRRYRKDLAHTLAEWDKAGVIDGHICGMIEGSELKHSARQQRAKRHSKFGKSK